MDVLLEKEYVDFEGFKFFYWYVILFEICVKFFFFIVLFGILIGFYS